jgi:hypothetical protein
MSHYGEEDLVLYYYGEGRRRAEIEGHLDTCAACAAAYREIAGTLEMIAALAVPERGEQYGLEVWQRIRHRLPERRAGWARLLERFFQSERVALAAAAATLMIAAFVAGRFWAPGRSQAPPIAVTENQPATATATADVRHRILITSVADHLDRSERILTDIMNVADRSDISAEQRWADDLLITSRLYRQDAEDLGEQSVASVLDDLERSLIEIVHSPSQASAADLDEMRRRIDAAALLFKVRILSEELQEREGARAPGDTTPRTSTRKTS